MTPPFFQPLDVYDGGPFMYTFEWTTDPGSVLWSAGATFAVNEFVRPFPEIVDAFGEQRFFRATAITSGVTGATQPAGFATVSYGQTVVDNGVTWTCVASTEYPVDITGATATMAVRASPDAPDIILTLSTSAAGIVIQASGLGTISVTMTEAQVDQLLGGYSYASYSLRLIPSIGSPLTLFYGGIELHGTGGSSFVPPTPPSPPIPANQYVGPGQSVTVIGNSITACDPGSAPGGGCDVIPQAGLVPGFSTIEVFDRTKTCSPTNPIRMHPLPDGTVEDPQNPNTFSSTPVLLVQQGAGATWIYMPTTNQLVLQ